MTPLSKAAATRGTALFLIAVNIIPLAGVLFWNWSLFQIVALYWLENVVMGGINLLKMLVSSPHDSAFSPENTPASIKRLPTPRDRTANHLSKVFLMPFFTFHYGAFCAIHGVFIATLLGGPHTPGGGLFNVLPSVFSSALAGGGLLAAAALTLSHLVSFGHHFIISGDYRRTAAAMLMGEPYPRIFVLHIAIIFGAWIILALGSPLALLIVLVAGKTTLDLNLHSRSHSTSPQKPGNRFAG